MVLKFQKLCVKRPTLIEKYSKPGTYPPPLLPPAPPIEAFHSVGNNVPELFGVVSGLLQLKRSFKLNSCIHNTMSIIRVFQLTLYK